MRLAVSPLRSARLVGNSSPECDGRLARYSGAIAEYFLMSEVRLHHHGRGLFSFENVPVGPFASRSARRTGSSAACWTVREPWKLLRSVAVKPGYAALTLMPADSRSEAKATVIALSAVFDEVVVYRIAESLLAAEIPLSGLNGCMPKQKLNLLKLSALPDGITVRRCSAHAAFRIMPSSTAVRAWLKEEPVNGSA
jgi:hypothetical protein